MCSLRTHEHVPEQKTNICVSENLPRALIKAATASILSTITPERLPISNSYSTGTLTNSSIRSTTTNLRVVKVKDFIRHKYLHRTNRLVNSK